MSRFVSDAAMREIVYHGLTDPLAILGNVILLILNRTSYQFIKAQQKTSMLILKSPACRPEQHKEERDVGFEDLQSRCCDGHDIVSHDIQIALAERKQQNGKSASW
ncbi:hypothetical protein PSHT_03388 [Puccinia striiformis]|uniref:Uncharacterized protein n=3 Tax=Puccinia striiformis TaxID=27350 RepID=A0A0L0VSR5_9BASI|nr:hypothetical protein H4Q26_013246 [Puccinia striiformis f. sp. tritici PST-130]KAI9628162.1 hypothetical protein H4Q26_018175 [Puccinia striiformis f. sp. tritici PST-130]KNF02328.1 hypothetical protein PSTG_04531 [Puccinia striiformis f. sp. tritici PST-78]POW00228.1 hypothetical protein PSTT_13275 [Puccinia striiformis]POW20531.1 hypothetical protein PSHT_03388 [Puccinia striiformis]